MNGNRRTALCGTVLAALAILAAAAGEAQARPPHRHHGRPQRRGPEIVIGGFFAPAPIVQRHWVPGRYETRPETVMVEPGRHEMRWVPPVTETRRGYDGRFYTVVVCPGRHEKVWVPPRYETRPVNVWVPGYYVETHVPPPPHGGYHFGIRF